jgi:hypothetical protein
MKKLIFSLFALTMFHQAFSFALVCYDGYDGQDCFYTNYNCDDFDNCNSGCTCYQLSIRKIMSDDGAFEIKTEGTVLLIRRFNSSSNWTSLVNLASIIDVDTEVWKITISCALDRVSLGVYDATCLDDPESTENCFVTTKNIYYVCP